MEIGSPNPLIAHYVAEIIERADALATLADGLVDDDFVSADAPNMIRMIGGLARKLKPVAIDRWEKYQGTGSRRHYTFLKGLDATLRRLAGDLRLPERATSDRVPGTLTHLVSAKLKLIEPQCGLILRPQWNYNYKVLREDIGTQYSAILAELLPSMADVEAALKPIPRPLFVISFPILERRSIHLHSVLGHEIGHIMARKYLDPEAEQSAFEQFVQRLADERPGGKPEGAPDASTAPGQATPQDTRGIPVEEAAEARRIAIREFAADAAGVLLFGISAVLGAADVAVSRGYRAQAGDSPKKYPSWGDRLQAMIELADAEGWLRFPEASSSDGRKTAFDEATVSVRTRIGEIRRWIAEEGNHGPTPSVWVARGHESAKALLPRIHHFLKSNFAPELFARPEGTFTRLPILFERLERGLPPDNVSPTDLSHDSPALEEIFAASWWWRLYRVKPLFTRNDLQGDVRTEAERLRRLTLKAIENVQFVADFEKTILGQEEQ